MDENCNDYAVGPTTVKVRVTGLTPGPHGFHLVSGFSSLPSIIHGFVCSKFSELFLILILFLCSMSLVTQQMGASLQVGLDSVSSSNY